MRTRAYLGTVAACLLLFGAVLGTTRSGRVAPGEAEVRAAVERVFEQLKSGQFGDLYEALPAASRARISRERFTTALERVRNMYALDRLEVGAARVSGSIAIVDTVMYGRLLRPVEGEGKIVAQQYLVREDGKWRVATGDQATIRDFLGKNVRFAKKFPIKPPEVFIKRDGQWVNLGSFRTMRRQIKTAS
jgi:hypothetical protein